MCNKIKDTKEAVQNGDEKETEKEGTGKKQGGRGQKGISRKDENVRSSFNSPQNS